MEVQIEHLGAVQFEIRARSHTIACDQPAENGGEDQGVTPPELLLASLGSCAGYFAAQYLRQQWLATQGTRVRATAEKETNPPRLARFSIEIETPVELTAEQLAGINQAVERCLIHNTLRNPPEIRIEIVHPALAAL